MKPTDDPFNDALRDRLGGYEADPDPLAFDRIRAELAKPETASPRRARWGRIVAGMLALLLVGTGLGERLFTPPGQRAAVGRFEREKSVSPEPAAVGFRPNSALSAVKSAPSRLLVGGVGAARLPGSRRTEPHRSPRQRTFSNLPPTRRFVGGFSPSPTGSFLENPKVVSENPGSSVPEHRPGLVLNQLQPHGWSPPRWVLPAVVGRPVPARSRRAGADRLAWFGAATGQYAYAYLTPNSTDGEFIRQVRSVGRFAPGRLGWRAQVGFEKPLSESWSLRFSLVFNQLNQKITYAEQTNRLDSVATRPLDPTSVVVQPFYQTRPGQTEFRQRFAGLNAAVLRRFGGIFYAVAGGEAGLAWGTTGRQPTIALTAGLGANRPLGGGWSLRVEPTLRLSPNAYHTNDGRFGWRPYTVGLAVGLRKVQ